MSSRPGSRALSKAAADALLTGRAAAGHDDLREIVGLLHEASAVPAPTPTAALAALLDDGFDPLPVVPARSASRLRRWSVRTAVATAAVVTATLSAATANALPAPLQTAVADVVGAVTPLQLPRPAAAADGDDDRGGVRDDRLPPTDPESGANADADGRPVEPGDGTSATVPTAPAVIAPPRRSDATVPPADDSDEPESDEPDAERQDDDSRAGEPDLDEPHADEAEVAEPDADEPDADEPDSDEPDSDEPDSDEPDADDTDADEADSDESRTDGPAVESDVPESDEPELDADGQLEQDQPEPED